MEFINNDDASPFDYADLTPEMLATPGAAPVAGAQNGGVGSPRMVKDENGYYSGRGTMFATPEDLVAYRKTGSLAKGDNGIGYFGGVDTTGAVPYVAVPRDVLDPTGRPDPRKRHFVEVVAPNGAKKVIQVGDVLPAVRNIRNGAVIDLNPAAAKLLGSGDSGGYKWRMVTQ
jgi:hypothetical protein